MTFKSRIIVPAILFGVFFSLSVLRGADWNTSDCSILRTDVLSKSGSQVTLARYPDAEEVTLDQVVEIRYEEDGRWFQVMDCAVKLLTEYSVRANSVVQSWYSERTSRARIEKVQIIKPDGKVVDIDVKALAATNTDTSSMNQNIYDAQDLIISVPVAGLEVGDILRYVLVDELLKPRLAGYYGNIFTLERGNPILRQSYIIDAPEKLPLKSTALRHPAPGVTPKHTSENSGSGRIIYKWEIANVPQAFPEPAMPSFHTQTMSLLVSTFTDWREVSAWYHRLASKRMNPTPAIREKVKELIADTADDGEKLRRIFDFVSQQVRYMGVTAEAEAPGWEPHEISMTFDQRAGVCRDKAALLAAMLQVAGFDSHPVLIDASSRKDPDVPMPYFNHAITAVAMDEGQWFLMDSTPTDGREFLPQYLAGKDYLVATEAGDTLRTTPVPESESATSLVRTWATLREDGTLDASTTIVLNGIADYSYRSTLLSCKNRSRFLESIYRNSLPGVHFQKITITPTDLLDNSVPLTIKMSYTIPDVLAGKALNPSEPLLLSLPSITRHLLGYKQFFRDATLDKRRFPYERDFISAYSEHISLALPRTLGIASIPAPLQLNANGLSFSREFFAAPGRIDVNEEYSTSKLTFSPEEYADLKAVISRISAEKRKRVVLIRQEVKDDETANAPAGEESDLLIENLAVNYIVHSGHSWTAETAVRSKILSRKGLDENSELMLHYNPVWEDVEIKYARVINGEEIIAVTDELQHFMDRESNGEAPRYPGGKTLVINFPSVQIGSVIEYCIVRKVRNRPFFSMNFPVRTDVPVANLNVALYAPKDMELEPLYLDNGPMAVDCADSDKMPQLTARKDKLADGRIKYSWYGSAIPQLPEEESTAGNSLPVLVANTGDWREYAAALEAVVESLGDGGEPVTYVAGLFASLPPKEKLIALRNWMELNIRHAGPAYYELPFSALSRPEITLTDGYGNSADRAILYHALLRAAGFTEVEIYLGGNSDENRDMQQLTASLPSLRAFSSWLVWVRHPDTGEIWLNDQNRHAQFGTCSADRTLLLNLRSGKLSSMKLAKKFADIDKVSCSFQINDDGSADISHTKYYRGTAFGIEKQRFAEMLPEERRRFQQSLIYSLAPGAEATGALITDFRHYPGTRTVRMKLQNFAVADDAICYFQLSSLQNVMLFANLLDSPRVTPFYIAPAPPGISEFTYVLPPSFQKVLSMPDDFFWQAPSGAGSISVKCRLLPGSKPAIRVTIEETSNQSVLSPAEYKMMVEAYKKFSSADLGFVILTR